MRSLQNKFTTLSFVSFIFLTSCGYAIEKSQQKLTLLTPGAQDARCDVYIDRLRYRMFPPETITVTKSQEDMKIVCMAPGNRDAEKVVKAELEKRALWGGPGVAWDYAAKSLYSYPEIISVNFTNIPVKPTELPKHNNPDVVQPEEHRLEEFSASLPALNSDRNEPDMPIMRRDELEMIETNADAAPNEELAPDEKGQLMDVIKRLDGDDYEGTTPQKDSNKQDSSNAAPVSIYPGQ